MKTLLMIVSTLMISVSAVAQLAPAVSNAKAIELSAHRIDRLVALKKIDATFATKMDTIEVLIVQDQAPVVFKTRVSQTKPATDKPMQVEMSLDKDGKPLAFQLIPGGVAGPDLKWTEKNAGELTENALHYVLENATNGKVALFDRSATSFTLSMATLKGESVALGQLRSSATTEKLNIYVKLDGTFISAEVVP